MYGWLLNIQVDLAGSQNIISYMRCRKNNSRVIQNPKCDYCQENFPHSTVTDGVYILFLFFLSSATINLSLFSWVARYLLFETKRVNTRMSCANKCLSLFWAYVTVSSKR